MNKAEGGRMKDEVGRSIRARLSRVFLFCLLPSAFCLLQTGCNVIGAVAAKVGPPPVIPAQYAPAKEPTLVLVENYHNPASLRLESDAVARHVSEQLAANEVGPIIKADRLTSFRSAQGPAYRKMPLDAIGKAVEASQVIYVDLEGFDITRAIASEMYGGRANARVRVVSTESGETLWPIDSAGGYPVSVKIEPKRVSPGTGDAGVRQALHSALADRVSKLFYDWTSETSDGAEEQF